MNAVVELNPIATTENEMTLIPLYEISVTPGFNPRFFIDQESEEFLEFCTTIAKHGVIQPIVVRPNESGGYSIIAGERRYRAALKVGLHNIPVVIKSVDLDTAKVMALIENAQRKDVTPIEEAESCHRLMDKYNGNHEEVIALLGWSKQKLDRRLLLVHAVEDVRIAFLKGQIPMGMVELLAGIPAESQLGTMKAAIEKNMTVAELKARLDAATEHLQLGRALFGTVACGNCPHNSSSQLGLFSESITEGRCMDRACFGKKTSAALAVVKSELSSRYNAVFLDTEKQKGSYAVVMSSGPQGVGTEQFNQCKGCANFGAYLSSAPGREGNIMEEVCFNPACMNEKIAALHVPIDASESAGAAGGGIADSATTVKAKATEKNKKAKTPKAGPAATPGKVMEAVDVFYRKVATEIASTSPEVRLAIAAYAMWVDTQRNFDLKPYETDGISMGNRDRDGLIAAFCRLPTNTLAVMVGDMAMFIAGKEGVVQTAVALVKVTGTDLTGRFTLTADYLKAHTKAGIDALLHEAKDEEGRSFPEWYNAKQGGDKAYKRLIGMKVDELVAEVMGCGFDFKKFVPSAVSSRL